MSKTAATQRALSGDGAQLHLVPHLLANRNLYAAPPRIGEWQVAGLNSGVVPLLRQADFHGLD